MFAVIETGGKQYRVSPGDEIRIELLASSGEDLEFSRILMISDDDGKVHVGSPVLEGARVAGTLVDGCRGPKIKVFKKKRRKGYRRTQGHRQDLLRVRISEISVLPKA